MKCAKVTCPQDAVSDGVYCETHKPKWDPGELRVDQRPKRGDLTTDGAAEPSPRSVPDLEKSQGF